MKNQIDERFPEDKIRRNDNLNPNSTFGERITLCQFDGRIVATLLNVPLCMMHTVQYCSDRWLISSLFIVQYVYCRLKSIELIFVYIF
jgi:hypothetical protein